MHISAYKAFDFGLTPAQESHALELHADALIIDMLYQGPLGADDYPQPAFERVRAMIDSGLPPTQSILKAMFAPTIDAARGDCEAFSQAWLGSGLTGGNRQIVPEPFDSFAWLYGVHQALFDNTDWIIKALKADDFRRAKAQGKAAGYLSTQNGPGSSLEMIESQYNLGLRMIQLTYNSMTAVGAGCTERTDAGVSLFGQACIEKMNELGIIVDTGHCGRHTTLDACALSSQPVVASHTAVAAICPHDRGKSDEEFIALAETGGVIGIVTVPFFLHPGGTATIEHMLDHIDYLRDLVGPAHIGLGTDWPLCAPRDLLQDNLAAMTAEVGFREEHKIDPLATMDGFDSYMDFPNITRGLVSRGYSDDDIRAILGDNFLRVFEQVCG